MRKLLVLAGLGALAFAVSSGPAQARTDTDPCPPGTYGVYETFSGPTLVCAGLESIPANEDRYLGVPFQDYENVDALPGSERLQCPGGTIIPGTEFWAHGWEWDYYVEGGSWVLWDGRVSWEWPQTNRVDQKHGYNAITAPFRNWGSPNAITARIFWRCELSERKAATAPELGDGSDDMLEGGGGDSVLIGSAGDDRLDGGSGDDHLHGGAGHDVAVGGAHDDLIHGRRAADTVSGGNGEDDILPGRGHDVARGGPDADQLFDDEGRDELRGGAGNDRFSSRDGDRDVIRCGRGEDIAIIDELDVAGGCEHAYRSARETPRKLPKI